MSDTPTSYSPFQLALRRLAQNKLALFGLVCVVVMTAGVLFIPMLCSTDPLEEWNWLNKKKPGFERPICANENTFMKGEPAETSASLLDANTLVFHTQKSGVVQYRANLRKGKVRSITLMKDAQPLDDINLADLPYPVYESTTDGGQGRILPKITLKVGEKPAPGFFETRVVEFETQSPPEHIAYTVALANGLVESVIEKSGDAEAPVDMITIPGDQVNRVVADGNDMTMTHWFGTDEKGRDLFVRIFYGGRISLMVGVVATAVSLIIGLIYGALSGYAGGRTDRLMMGAVDILYALPFTVLVILLMVISRNIIVLFIALGAVQWLTMARIVRGQVLSLKTQEFIEAARMSGASTSTIICRELIPHTLGPVIVYTTLTVPIVIMEESFLAFLGLQVQYQGLDSWGSLIKYGIHDLNHSWLLIFPSAAMVITLFGLNCLGDGLRDSFDPKRSVS